MSMPLKINAPPPVNSSAQVARQYKSSKVLNTDSDERVQPIAARDIKRSKFDGEQVLPDDDPCTFRPCRWWVIRKIFIWHVTLIVNKEGRGLIQYYLVLRLPICDVNHVYHRQACRLLTAQYRNAN